MQQSDRKRFDKAVIDVANAIGQGAPYSEGDLEMIFLALGDLDFSTVQQALIDHMNSANGKWRPNASYIREAIKARTGVQWLGGNEAWGRLAFASKPKTFKRANDWGDMVERTDYRAAEPGPSLMNQQMAQALAVAQPQIDAGDMIPARMTFIGTYERLVEIEKAAGRAPRYWVSTGGTHEEQAAVREEGVRLGLLNATWAPPAAQQLGHTTADEHAKFKMALAGMKMKTLPAPEAE